MTGKCTDEYLGQRLHHYELGLLSDEDRREFEIHLYSCDYCLDEVRRFQQTARLIKHEQRVKNIIVEMAEDSDERTSTTIARPASEIGNRLRPRVWIPAASFVVVMLMLLLMNPWGIRFDPTMEAVASKKRLAVMYFENLGDPLDESRLGEIASNLLITDLSEAYFLDVLSNQRLYDILKLLGKQDQKTVSRDVAYEVARKAQADYILAGSILQSAPEIVITAQLLDVESGLVISSHRETSEGDEQVFDVIDKLTADIRKAIPLPYDASGEIDRPVKELTTYSPEAYRNYITGVDFYNRYYVSEATESFEKVIAADSTFAMAYYYLSLLADEELIEKAVEHSVNVGQKERILIRSRSAVVAGDEETAIEVLKEGVGQFPEEKVLLFELGRIYYDIGYYGEAVRYLERSVEVDPLFEVGYNLLAYAHNGLGNFSDALRAINQYVSLVPDEPNPYDSRGDIYCANGLFDRAVESYRMALDRDRDFITSQSKLGDAYFALRDYEAAQDHFEEITSGDNPRPRPSARGYLALIPLQQGRLREAIDYLDEALLADSLEAGELWLFGMSYKHYLKAKAFASRRQFDNAVEEMSEAIRYQSLHSPYEKSTYRCLYVEYLIESGNVDSARSVTATLEKEELTGRASCSYDYARAMLHREAGDLESARSILACDSVRCNVFQFKFTYSKLLMESEMFAEAIQQLSGLLESRCLGQADHGFDVTLVQYLMGVCHEALGFHDIALLYYSDFLRATDQADADIVEIQDAKRRIASLNRSDLTGTVDASETDAGPGAANRVR